MQQAAANRTPRAPRLMLVYPRRNGKRHWRLHLRAGFHKIRRSVPSTIEYFSLGAADEVQRDVQRTKHLTLPSMLHLMKTGLIRREIWSEINNISERDSRRNQRIVGYKQPIVADPIVRKRPLAAKRQAGNSQ